MNHQKTPFAIFFFISLVVTTTAQIQPKNEWWLDEPYRLIQTNLREIDAKDFNTDVFVESLKEIGANAVLVNVGGIVANYYTDLDFHFQNKYLKFDVMKEVIQKCHDADIRVIGRFDFSKLNEEIAAAHPDWLYKSTSSEEVNFNGQVHTCVNGGYQQKNSLEILSEALTKFPLDGVFFNMIGYRTRDYNHVYHGICQANACRSRFKNWSGGLELPVKEDMDDPIFRQYRKFKEETTSELFYRIRNLIKSFGDHIAINTYTPFGTDFYRRESNSHAALYDDFVPWEYNAADKVKSALGSWKNKQVSNAAVHFYGYPARHSADANRLTEKRLIQNILHGAGLDFYCIGRLDNLEDRKVLQNVTEVFHFHKKHENFLHHTISENRVLLLNAGGSEYKGIFEMLTENHILFDVMEARCILNEDVPRDIEEYEVIILPDITNLSDEQCNRLDNFVKGGGKILATGLTSTKDEIGNPLNKIRMQAFGVGSKYKKFEKIKGTYYRIFEKDKQKLGSEILHELDLVYAWEEGLLCELNIDAEGYLGFIPPAMIGPPEKCYYREVSEIPGLIFNEFGKGKSAYLPFRIGSLYHHKRHYGHAELILSSLEKLLSFKQDIMTNASPLVEISRQISRNDDFEYYGLLNHSGQLGNGFFDPIPMANIVFTFEQHKKIKRVSSLHNGEEISYNVSENLVTVTIPHLEVFDIILVEF